MERGRWGRERLKGDTQTERGREIDRQTAIDKETDREGDRQTETESRRVGGYQCAKQHATV